MTSADGRRAEPPKRLDVTHRRLLTLAPFEHMFERGKRS